MNEQHLVAAAILDREAFGNIQTYMDSSELSPLGKYWLTKLEEYYERDAQAGAADIPVLRALGLESASTGHRETLGAFFDGLPLIGASSSNMVAAIFSHKRNQLGLRLAQQLADPSHNQEEVNSLLEQYRDLSVFAEGTPQLEYVDYDRLGEFLDPEKVIPLFPQKVFKPRTLFGGALPGHHILIYGRTEQGKTLFCVFQAAAIAQAGHRVLYIVNEENASIHATRAACCLSGISMQLFEERQDEVLAIARTRGLDNISFLQLEPGTFGEIEQAIKETNPDVVVVDQLSGVDVGESNPVQAIGIAARRMRTILSRHGVVGISVHQAGDRTERYGQQPPAWLTLSDIYGSRTLLPAQCDLIIGIGSDEDMHDRGERAISLPKNKIGGSHEGFLLRFDAQRNRCVAL